MTTEDKRYTELATSLIEISQLVFVEPTVHATLQRIVDLAPLSIDGCDAVSISMSEGDQVATSIFTDQVALDIDRQQYLYDEGPCLDAIRVTPMLYSTDLTSDIRWPRFGPMAKGLGMRSVLSCRLTVHKVLGSLNLYAKEPDAFDMLNCSKAVVFSAHAGVALDAAGDLRDVNALLRAEISRSSRLEGAVATREVIGQAEGILMEREQLNPDQAFDLLKRTSQRLNVKLRSIAQYVVDTGDVPKE